MKRFAFLVIRFSLLLILSAVLLDILFTFVYVNASGRNKIDFLCNSHGREYDVVVLGSSRANNHFVSEVFEKKGLKTFNFGMSGSHLFESALVLKIMQEKEYKIKKVVLEADLNLVSNEMADGIASSFLPYIHTSQVVKEHFRMQNDFKKWYYIPFYRYLHYESRIGFREMFFNLIHKKTNDLENDGYRPLYGFGEKMKYDLSKYKPIRNKYYEEIKKICKEKNIELLVVSTPMCKNTVNIDYFAQIKKIYPEIHNCENFVEEDKYFSSCGHMNNEGAVKFTERIVNEFF